MPALRVFKAIYPNLHNQNVSENRLPNRENARIASTKITEYLLSPTHIIGKTKAQFFCRHGYDKKDAGILKRDLLEIAKNGIVVSTSSSPFGQKYTVDGSIVTPKGVLTVLRTVWIIEPGDDHPRFITAYPA